MQPSLLLAGGILCSEAMAYGRERWSRRNRYDLTLLNDVESYHGPSRDDPNFKAETPDWEAEEGDTIYCQRCDISMPTTYSICPKCGAALGH